ncbi:MAG: hypothetical protein LBC68_13355 [Prevotellaceae bacterium]|nr:hypothetical protein [Prevotellaceae bacterium]
MTTINIPEYLYKNVRNPVTFVIERSTPEAKAMCEAWDVNYSQGESNLLLCATDKDNFKLFEKRCKIRKISIKIVYLTK